MNWASIVKGSEKGRSSEKASVIRQTERIGVARAIEGQKKSYPQEKSRHTERRAGGYINQNSRKGSGVSVGKKFRGPRGYRAAKERVQTKINISNLERMAQENQERIITSIINTQCENKRDVKELLDQMEEYNIMPTCIHYNSIINKHCKTKEEAVVFLQEMEDKGIEANEVTYNSIINKHC